VRPLFRTLRKPRAWRACRWVESARVRRHVAPGSAAGGAFVFCGSPSAMTRSSSSVTAARSADVGPCLASCRLDNERSASRARPSVMSALTQSVAYPQERERTASIPADGSPDYATISPGDSSQPAWMLVKVDDPGAGGNSFHPAGAALASAPWAPRCSATRRGWCPMGCPG
jgi:hypothetical protein